MHEAGAQHEDDREELEDADGKHHAAEARRDHPVLRAVRGEREHRTDYYEKHHQRDDREGYCTS